MTKHRLLSLIAFALLLAACRDDGSGSIDHDAYDRSSSALVSTESTLEVSDDVLGFDPVLDRTHTADQNAMDVEAHVAGSLNGCGTVTRTGTTITVDFGTSGCTTPSGHSVAGSISVVIASSGAEASATLTFTHFTVDGRSVSGTLAFTTSASRLGVDIALTSGSDAISGSATIGAGSGTFSLDASLTATRASTTTTLTVAGLVWDRGDCYPSAGTVTATTGRLVQSMTFDASTAMSGMVTVVEGPITSAETLPAYGDCPTS